MVLIDLLHLAFLNCELLCSIEESVVQQIPRCLAEKAATVLLLAATPLGILQHCISAHRCRPSMGLCQAGQGANADLASLAAESCSVFVVGLHMKCIERLSSSK